MMNFYSDELASSIGFLDDNNISFNINRKTKIDSKMYRQIIAIPNSGDFGLDSITAIPGVSENKERQLIQELKEMPNWDLMERFSFSISDDFFSFLWRFKICESSILQEIRDLEVLNKEETLKIKSKYRKYQDYLTHCLSRGQVYIVPDKELTFKNNGNRKTKIYGRPVLINYINGFQLSFIPFSTKIKFMRKSDILFDREYQGQSLSKEEDPPIENFPYKMFTKKNCLVVNAEQPMIREDFLNIALVPIGSVRKELMSFLSKK